MLGELIHLPSGFCKVALQILSGGIWMAKGCNVRPIVRSLPTILQISRPQVVSLDCNGKWETEYRIPGQSRQFIAQEGPIMGFRASVRIMLGRHNRQAERASRSELII
jgi:hypothetical protein